MPQSVTSTTMADRQRPHRKLLLHSTSNPTSSLSNNYPFQSPMLARSYQPIPFHLLLKLSATYSSRLFRFSPFSETIRIPWFYFFLSIKILESFNMNHFILFPWICVFKASPTFCSDSWSSPRLIFFSKFFVDFSRFWIV